jgi:hypothetical protein
MGFDVWQISEDEPDAIIHQSRVFNVKQIVADRDRYKRGTTTFRRQIHHLQVVTY